VKYPDFPGRRQIESESLLTLVGGSFYCPTKGDEYTLACCISGSGCGG